MALTERHFVGGFLALFLSSAAALHVPSISSSRIAVRRNAVEDRLVSDYVRPDTSYKAGAAS
jgi:hypothetical protein